MIKKVNAVLAFLAAIAMLLHIAAMSAVLCGVSEFLPVFSVIGKALSRVFLLHVCLSVGIMFFSGGNGFRYPKLNKSTVVQRLSSLLLLIVIHFHMGNYFTDQGFVPPRMFGFVTELLLTALLLSHYLPSVDKGLLSLGINSKALTLIVRIVFLPAFALAFVSVCVYFLGALV